MFNPLSPVVAKEDQHRLLHEAQRGAFKTVRAAGPPIKQRLFVRAGDLLISAGLRLQGDYKPAR